jgi:hypothetical protein
MKRFLGILVAFMFLGSAAYAAEPPAPKSRAETEDRKVGFEGEQKTPGQETKGGAAPKTRPEDRKVGFEGEQKTTK